MEGISNYENIKLLLVELFESVDAIFTEYFFWLTILFVNVIGEKAGWAIIKSIIVGIAVEMDIVF